MGPRSTLKAMRSALARLREEAASLTVENGHYACASTLRFRDALNTAITDGVASIRQHVEKHDAEATPVQATSKSQELRAATRNFEAANAALEEGKR